MAYDLSFSPEFFFAEGEPYDCTLDLDGLRNGIVKPTSVYQALCVLSDEDLIAAAETCTGKPWPIDRAPEPECFLDYVERTNTCSNLDSPVEVWIDPDGEHRIKVYDKR